MEANSYSVEILMDEKSTVADLQAQKMILYVMKAVSVDDTKGAKPTVWFQQEKLRTHVTICWKEDYGAYVSDDTVQEGAQINVSDEAPIQFGKIFKFNDDSYEVVDSPESDFPCFGLENSSDKVHTVGLTQDPGGIIFGFPLNGGHMLKATPLCKLLLFFATHRTQIGCVLANTLGPAVLVDLTEMSDRKLKYDINKGWSTNIQAGDEGPITTFSPDTDIVSHLIAPSEKLLTLSTEEKPKRAFLSQDAHLRKVKKVL